MIDLKQTTRLLTGGLLDSQKTWHEYLPDANDWKKTALLLTGPLIILSALGAYITGFIGSGSGLFSAFRPTLLSTVGTIITSAIGAVVFAFVVSLVSGAFGGKKSFPLALAATSLAFIPSYIGQALMWLPWVGGILSLGLFIYALVLLWKVIPVYLSVPDGKRAGHYILSIVAAIVVLIVLSATIGRLFTPSWSGSGFTEPTIGENSSAFDGGVYGSLARQAQLIEAAENDRYSPPSDGRLSKKQVAEFTRVMARTEELRQKKMDQYKAIAEKAEKDQDISFKDIGSILGGVTDAAGLQTAEIEVVKSSGGNWAEHQWVKNSLRTAMIQKDGNSAVEFNYKLYSDYEQELSQYLN